MVPFCFFIGKTGLGTFFLLLQGLCNSRSMLVGKSCFSSFYKDRPGGGDGAGTTGRWGSLEGSFMQYSARAKSFRMQTAKWTLKLSFRVFDVDVINKWQGNTVRNQIAICFGGMPRLASEAKLGQFSLMWGMLECIYVWGRGNLPQWEQSNQILNLMFGERYSLVANFGNHCCGKTREYSGVSGTRASPYHGTFSPPCHHNNHNLSRLCSLSILSGREQGIWMHLDI